MSLLIRKINRNKWFRGDIIPDDVPADAVTNCMRTQSNTLSVWEIADANSVDEAVLAIVSGGQHLESIDIVLMNSEHLQQNGVDWIRTEGRTPVEELADTHLDLSNLSYKTLGVIAYHIADKFKENQIKRYTKGRLKEILNDAIKKNRLDLTMLDDSLRRKL